jgi:SAM-dependent methyltransferase
LSKRANKRSIGWFSRHWNDLNSRTIGSERYWSIALQNASQYADVAPVVEEYLHGRTLDLGAGRLAWRELLKQYSTSYVSGDLIRDHPDLDVLFDATGSYPFPDNTFDSIFCCSVLEHVQKPWNAFSEMWRILAPGGTAIVSVPFVFYLHGQPHDYYRFTLNALRYLAERDGFKVEKALVNGGLTTLLLNIPSVVMSTLLSSAKLGRFIPAITSLFMALDKRLARYLDRGGLFAMNHIVVLRKSTTASSEEPSWPA